MASLDLDASRMHIDEAEAGSRLDRALLRHIGQEKRQLVMRLIRRGNVRVNGKRAKVDQRLHEGDSIFLPASLRVGKGPDAKRPKEKRASLTNVQTLFEDDHILVLNKPAGVVVHSGSGYSAGLIEQLRELRKLPELRLVHRLDRDTSGCLLLAKTLPILRILAEDFRSGRMHKTYLSWVTGHMIPTAGRMQSFLRKGVTMGGERMVVHDESGQKAITDYQVIQHVLCQNEEFSFLALMPLSGRTHQLRVQLQYENHSIFGDHKYSSRPARDLFRSMGGKGMALHAWRLRFVHPVTHQSLELRAPVPAWWASCFNIKN